MVIAEVSVVPLGTQTPSTSDYVVKAIKVLRQEKGIKYDITAMGTVMEGELDKVLQATKKMHESLFDDRVKRVITSIKIDDRRDKESSISSKIQSVKQKVGM